MLFHCKSLVLLLAFSASFSLVAGKKNPVKGINPTAAVPNKKKMVMATDIIEFNAISDGRRVYVNWASGNQKNYDYYTIEKAKDGVHFEAASMVKGAGGSSLVDYVDIDYSPYAGISYYRLKQTDYAGNESYSDVVSVNYQFSKDGTVISCRESDPIEAKEIEKKEILVVLRNANGEEYVSKILLNDLNGGIFASDTRNRLKQGNYKVIASSYNRLFSQELTIR